MSDVLGPTAVLLLSCPDQPGVVAATADFVKRYERVLQQQGEKLPDFFPFEELLAAAKADTTLDPFDAMEMLGVNPDTSGNTPTTGAAAGGEAAPTPGGR